MAQPAVKKSIYLDVCALCRSFDDQRYLRIRLETAAVELIMERVRSGDYCLYYSPAHRFEVEAFDDRMSAVKSGTFFFIGEVRRKSTSYQGSHEREQRN